MIRDLLPPATVAILRRFALRLPGRVRGPGIGIHQSPDHGTGAEFVEHRAYTRGDDLRDLDWRASARGDRLYIKRFAEETNLPSGVFVDVSGSMGLQLGETSTKLDYARELTAALVYLLVNQGDPVAVGNFGGAETALPASARPGQIARAITFLETLVAQGDGSPAESLARIPDRVPPGGGVFLIGDFYDDPASLASALRRFRQRKQRVVVFHVLAESEATLPAGGTVAFQDLESDSEIIVDAASYGASYATAFSDYCVAFRTACEESGVHYVRASTSQTAVETIAAFLTGKARGDETMTNPIAREALESPRTARS